LLEGKRSRAALIVEDYGTGMTEETKRRAFEWLFTSKPTGTGIGLPMVRQITDDHGADIRLDTKLGKGTKFTVSFPAEPSGGG
jgi:signal transduction histidine kinase